MRLQGQAKLAKKNENEAGSKAYLTLQDWGQEFSVSCPASDVKSAKEGDMVNIDGDVKFGRGKYGMYMSLDAGAVKMAKAG